LIEADFNRENDEEFAEGVDQMEGDFYNMC
jgi:hypothetical protein